MEVGKRWNELYKLKVEWKGNSHTNVSCIKHGLHCVFFILYQDFLDILGFGFILKQLLAENTQNLSNKVNEEINTA